MRYTKMNMTNEKGKPEQLFILRMRDDIRLEPLVYIPACDKYINSNGETFYNYNWKKDKGLEQEITLYSDKTKEEKSKGGGFLGLFCMDFSSVGDSYHERAAWDEPQTLFRTYVDALESYIEWMKKIRDGFNKDIFQLEERLEKVKRGDESQ